MKLRGDLRKFPFRDGKEGIFEVRGKFREATLRYADDWPEINDIEGELLFTGQRMLITGKGGKIFGVNLREVRAEIADIEQNEELLTVNGKAAGATADFLRFVSSSPIGERIDHFTQEMQAEGNGELDLKLSLPLRKLGNTRVDGSFRLDANRLTVDKNFPPITEVRGALRFSANHIEARGLRGLLLGAPLSVDVKTSGEGEVQVNAAGEYSVAALRQQMPNTAVLDHLAGSTKWTGNLRIKDKSADIKLTSNLVGLSSSLPEPFNKSAADAMPVSFERKKLPPAAAPPAAPVSARGVPGKAAAAVAPTPSAREPASGSPLALTSGPGQDITDVRIGKAWRLQMVRRHDSTRPVITRGVVAMGDANPAMPERGTPCRRRSAAHRCRGLAQPLAGSRQRQRTKANPCCRPCPRSSSTCARPN